MRVCVIPGDGIGPEVLGVATRILQALVPSVALSEAEAGWATFERHGTALPAATLAAAQAADAILFGAVASPSHSVPGYRSPIVQLRRELDLYANIRPTQMRASANQPAHSLVVVRENTEGLYAGRERLADDGATAIAERVITRQASTRIVRAACELARSRAHDLQRPGRVTIVHKANVLRVSDGLFRETALAVVRDYPDLTHDELLVDVAAMHLAQSPQRFDVIVTTNMFGDILSDVACIHGGGLGLAASANLGEQRALFEPVHGAAPDIVGRGCANPLAAIECVAMLLAWRKLPDQAARLRKASATVLRDGPHTPDLGGNATTEALAEAVLAQL
ncbi:isocitrate/isopropylmalate dehydrogenase family protein [Candidatus Viridilinea mediisalina]|uniref:Isocitrate/homoisocitrate dehydrogenase n=1 Tax=Candidatus Viridilinea mediisalina TaxID=2024553 RepID=A0A2A6RKI5_9CHLR|nr:isocitrate/isopropylmalate dehydrogenase family protein [Candidatus Viridilinea mediisalina]PDW03390.1 isocitrate dehydrogenase [Candidatus Viridilinea mediisalina]